MADKFHDYDALPTDSHAPPFGKELRVVAVVVGFIIVLEIIARIIAPTLDYDRENIHAFPEVIADLGPVELEQLQAMWPEAQGRLKMLFSSDHRRNP